MSQITIEYKLNGGTLSSVVGEIDPNNSSKYALTTPLTESVTLPLATKTGYNFAGWYLAYDEKTDEFSNQISQITAGVTEDITVYAKWTESTDTKYTIIHVRENIDDSNYNLTGDIFKYDSSNTEIETLAGTTKSIASFVKRTYTGFSSDLDVSYYTYSSDDNVSYNLKSTVDKTISPDGTTLILIKYSRVIVTFTFNALSGEAKDSDLTQASKSIYTISGKYGKSLSIDVPVKAGYTGSWTPAVKPTFDEDTLYTAVYTANTNTKYTVNVYYQTADFKEGYSGPEVLKFSGTTGTLTTVTEDQIKTSVLASSSIDIDNCKLEKFTQIEIKGDETSSIDVYYSRALINVTFNFNEGTIAAGALLPTSSSLTEKISSDDKYLTITMPAGHKIDFGADIYKTLFATSSYQKIGYSCGGYEVSGVQTYTTDKEYLLAWNAITY